MKKLINKYRRTILVSSLVLFSFLYYLSQTETAIKSAPGSQSPEWKLATDNARFPGRSGHKCLLFKNKLWIIGGWNGKKVLGDIWFSNDGIDWKCALKSAPFPPRAAHSALVYKNKIWVIGGLNFDRDMDIRDMNDCLLYTSPTPRT